ncbi:MAG: enolase C-terminal domain-like protein [Myxococcota bacterium]
MERLSLRPFARKTPGAENARARWPERRGVLVTLEACGRSGYGEVSPLPGYSPETLESTLREAEGLSAEDLVADPESWSGCALPPLRSPSLRFGLEAALLDLASRLVERPAWSLLAPSASAVGVAEVLTSLDSAVEDAERCLAVGFRTLKLKIGRPQRFADELAVLRRLRRLDACFELRVDVNQAFGPEVASRLSSLSDAGVDLVEEPTPNPVEWPQYETPPLALDESLQRWMPGQLPEGAGGQLRALVLKPAVLGGLRATMAWAATARSMGMDVIISHLFDGPAAAAALRTLAVVVGGSAAHGLGAERGRGPQLVPDEGPGLGFEPSAEFT